MSYKVNLKECYKVPFDFASSMYHGYTCCHDNDGPLDGPEKPCALSQPMNSQEPMLEPEVPFLIGIPEESDPSPQVPNSSENVYEPPTAEAAAQPTAKDHSRPKCTSKQPKYLEDYIR